MRRAFRAWRAWPVCSTARVTCRKLHAMHPYPSPSDLEILQQGRHADVGEEDLQQA